MQIDTIVFWISVLLNIFVLLAGLMQKRRAGFILGLLLLGAVYYQRYAANVKIAEFNAVAEEAKADASRAKSKAEEARLKQKEADVKIAASDAVAKKAITNVAAANVHVQQLKNENIKLRADLESATAESRSRQATLAIEQQKLSRAQQLQADAERKRAEAQIELEKTLEKVRERQNPRTLMKLSAGQRRHLIELLKVYPKSPVEISCMGGDTESVAFAKEIYLLLQEAGWRLGELHQTIGHNEFGLKIKVQKAETPYAAALQKAFGDVGYQMGGIVDSGLPDGTVEVWVGSKQ